MRAAFTERGSPISGGAKSPRAVLLVTPAATVIAPADPQTPRAGGAESRGACRGAQV
jgi:hypothetical protein